MHIAGESLLAMPERSLYWAGTRTLAVSDLHLGKDEGLRAAGAPVPTGPMQADLERLSRAIERTDPERVVIVGDLIHGRLGLTDRVIEAVAAWRDRHACSFVLVMGNHERSARGNKLPGALEAWRMDTADPELTVGAITFVHDPDAARGPAIAGHIHPAVSLGRAKAPAFTVRDDVLTLPAFSAFTAGAPIDPRAFDDVVCCCEGQVVRLTPQPPEGGGRTPTPPNNAASG